MSTRNNQSATDFLLALRINTTAAVGATAGDVVQGLVSLGVQEGVQEAKCGLAGAQTGIVKQTNDTSEGGRGGGGTTRAVLLAGIDNLVAADC